MQHQSQPTDPHPSLLFLELLALRVRPLTSQDRAQPRFSQSTESDVIKTFDTTVNVVPHQKAFTFDHVFGTDSTQEQVFSSVASKLVDRFIDGKVSFDIQDVFGGIIKLASICDLMLFLFYHHRLQCHHPGLCK